MATILVIAPSTDKNMENGPERGQNLLQNGILNFAFRLSQSPAIALKS